MTSCIAPLPCTGLGRNMDGARLRTTQSTMKAAWERDPMPDPALPAQEKAR